MRFRHSFLVGITLCSLSSSFAFADSAVSRQPDPTGARTGAVSDITAANTGQPTFIELANQAGHNKVSINILWALLAGYLIMFMAAGFAMMEAGFTRAKNAAHTVVMNLMIYPVCVAGFYICGFAFMFGGAGPIGTLGGYGGLNHEVSATVYGRVFGIFGARGFLLDGGAADVAVFTLFFFHLVFMGAAAAIPTGAMAERWKFLSFFIAGLIVSTIIYPLFGNWVWGGGWLSTLGANFHLGHGYVDFAGSTVVHMTGGMIALVGAWMLGPRIGKFNRDGSINAIPGHNIPMAVLGTLVLAFCWFVLNPGSTLAGTDLRIAAVAVNTLLASAAGCLASTLWTWTIRTKKPDPGMMCNGLLAGLVAISAPCAFVNSSSACIIGVVAGILVVEGVFFIERVFKIDDPVGAVAVHGINGAWGSLSLGLFADGTYGDGWNKVPGTVRGLFYGDSSQLAVQAIGVVVNFLFVGVCALIMFKALDVFIGNRVSPAAEVEGLNVPEMGTAAYAGIKMDKFGETPFTRV